MVCDVPGKNVGQRPNGKGVPAGYAGSHPGLSRQISKEGKSRQADSPELLDMTGPRKLVGPSSASTNVLIEARQGALETARKPECAEQEGPLAVVDMIQYLADSPLLRRVAVKRLLLGDAPQESDGFFQLSLQLADDIVARDPVDVGEVVRRGLVAFWRSHHAIILARGAVW